MSLSHIAKRLEDLGCRAEPREDGIDLDIDDAEIHIPVDDDWLKAINTYYKSRQYKYDPTQRVLTSNRGAEFQVVRLDPGYFYRVEHTFSDKKGNTVSLAPASRHFKLAYFGSDRYEKSFERVKARLLRRITPPNSLRRSRPRRLHRRFDDLFFSFHTATFMAPRKPRGKSVIDVAIEPIKSCLFALAHSENESWELTHAIKAKGLIYRGINGHSEGDQQIPHAAYDDAAVTFYKVAKSSQFPSQVFLAFYHVLELHFLRVADESLFNAVCAQLNNPDFRSTYSNVTKLLAAIKRNDNTSNEKDMLLGVLRKYVSEDEFISFIRDSEAQSKQRLFTNTKDIVFSERYCINIDKGHALNTAAIVIKHIRNALVHSSDKYSRQSSFVPMSESEDTVVRYIAVVQFFAERVIFATAKRDL